MASNLGINRAKNETIRNALMMAKRPHFAIGGGVTEPVLNGPILGNQGGRTDTIKAQAPEGSYILPADVVSGIPGAQGSSLSGHTALTKLFKALPYTPDEAPYGAGSPGLSRGRTMPGISNMHHLMANTFAQTGQPSLAKGGAAKGNGGHVPVMVASDEFAVHPQYVKRLGYWSGDKENDRGKRDQNHLKRGHEILDALVKDVRAKNIKALQKLPGPVKK